MEALQIKIDITADGAGVGRGMGLATASVVGFQQAATGALAKVTSAFAGLSTGTKLLGGLGLGLAAASFGLKASIGPAIQFESAFAGVLKTVDGTRPQLEAIRTGLLDLSKVMPTSAADLASIAENAGQLGIAAGDVVEFTRVIAQLGETTDLDFDSAAQSLARFINITGGQATITQLADVIVELGNNSATTESQIVTFATRLSGAFTVAGASEDQILALGSAFSSLGLSAEAGSSALNRVITQISDAAKLGGKDLAVFAETAGLLPEQFAEIARTNPVEALVLFGEGLGRITDEGRSITPVLETLGLAGIRTSNAMTTLALGSADVRRQLALAANQLEIGGAAATEFGKRTETTASRLATLQNRINAVAIAAGTPLLGGLARSADLAGDAIERLVEILTPLVAQLGTAFGQTAEAILPLLAAITSPALTIGVGLLEGLAGALTTVLGILSSLGGPATAIAALVAALAFVGPVSVIAADGLIAVGTAGKFAATGVLSVSAALSGLLLVGLVAGLVIFGDELETIGQAAKKAGDAYRDDFAAAIADVDYAALDRSLDGIKGRIEEIQNTAGVELDGGLAGWGQALQNVLDIANVFNSEATVPELRSELEALQGVLDSTDADEFGRGIDLLAERLGITSQQAIEAAIELGLVEAVVRTGATAQENWALHNSAAVATLEAHFAAAQELAGETGLLIDQIMAGTVSMEQYAAALDVTTDSLAFLADRVGDGVLDDLLGDDPEAALAAWERINDEAERVADLAGQVGLTTDEFREQIGVIGELADAYSDLRSVIDGTKSAMELLDAQQRAVAEATTAYDEALAGLDGSEESFLKLVDAAKDLSLEQAALAPSARAAVEQYRETSRALVQAGIDMGLTRDRAIELAAAQLGIDEAIIIDIQDIGSTEVLEAIKTIEDRAKALGDELFPIDFEARVEAAREDIIGLDGLASTVAGADYIMRLEAEAEEAREKITGIGSHALTVAQADYLMRMEAEAEDARNVIDEIAGLGRSVANSDFIMRLQARDAGASAEIRAKRNEGDAYATAKYEALMTAADAGASALIESRRSQARSYASDDYTALLTARDAGASRQIALEQALANAYDGRYNADLTARDLASSVIRRAIRTLSGFRSKSIRITTFLSTIRKSADGGIDYPGISAFDSGGLASFMPAGAVRERPGTAQIYRPVTPGRFFAEPETGGESYIPLGGSKRAQAIPIWLETGRILGMLANGGIQAFQNGGLNSGSTGTVPQAGGSLVTFAPVVQVSLSGLGGLDEESTARLVGTEVEKALDRTARQLANLRS